MTEKISFNNIEEFKIFLKKIQEEEYEKIKKDKTDIMIKNELNIWNDNNESRND